PGRNTPRNTSLNISSFRLAGYSEVSVSSRISSPVLLISCSRSICSRMNRTVARSKGDVSFVSQGDHGVHFGNPAGGDVAGGESDKNQHRRDRDHGRHIRGAGIEQEAREQARQGQRSEKSENQACY